MLPGPPDAAIRQLLERICASPQFYRRFRLQQFLRFVVAEELAGRGEEIKEYSVGLTVYARQPAYDPRLDATVRVEASKLRGLLKKYYADHSYGEPIVLSMAKGGYRPQFTPRPDPPRDGANGSLVGNSVGLEDPYVRGRYMLYKATDDGARRSAAHYRQTIEQDSRAAQAYAELANSHNFSLAIEMIPPREAVPTILTAAKRALELDSASGAAHIALTFMYCLLDWDWNKAEDTVRRGLELSPQDAMGHFCIAGLHFAQQRHEEGLAAMRSAISLEPLSLFYNAVLGFGLYYAHRFEEAIRHLKQILELEPAFPMAHLWLGLCYVEVLLEEDALRHIRRATELLQQHPRALSCLGYAHAAFGGHDEARQILAMLREAAPRHYVSPVGLAAIEGALGQRDRAFEELDAAESERSYALIWLNVDPRFGRMHDDLRFREVLVRQRLIPQPQATPITG